MNGEYDIYNIDISYTDEKADINIHMSHSGYDNKYKEIEFNLINKNNRSIIINGEEQECISDNILYRLQ